MLFRKFTFFLIHSLKILVTVNIKATVPVFQFLTNILAWKLAEGSCSLSVSVKMADSSCSFFVDVATDPYPWRITIRATRNSRWHMIQTVDDGWPAALFETIFSYKYAFFSFWYILYLNCWIWDFTFRNSWAHLRNTKGGLSEFGDRLRVKSPAEYSYLFPCIILLWTT